MSLAHIEEDVLLLVGAVYGDGQKQSLTEEEISDVIDNVLSDHEKVKGIRTLRVQNFELDSEAATKLSDLILKLPGVETIDLTGTHIGEYLPEITHSIKSWVASNLNLTQCNLTIKEIASLAKSLDSISCSILQLNVSFNPITCHGLGLLLKWGCGVTDLEANFCGIMSNDKRSGVDFLLEGLSENIACTVLCLHGNGFEPALMTRIRRGIEANPRSQLTPGNVIFIDRQAPVRIGNVTDYMKKEDKKGVETAVEVGLKPTLETSLPWPTMIRGQADSRVLADIRRACDMDGSSSFMSRRSRTSELGLRDLSLLGGVSCATSRSPSFAMSSPRSSPRLRKSVEVRNDMKFDAVSPRTHRVSITAPEKPVQRQLKKPPPAALTTTPASPKGISTPTRKYLGDTECWSRHTETASERQNWAKNPKSWPAATHHDVCSSPSMINSPIHNHTASSQAKIDDFYEGDLYERLGKEVHLWPSRTFTAPSSTFSAPSSTKKNISARLTQTTASWRGKYDYIEDAGRWVSKTRDGSSNWKKTPTSWPESTSSTPNGLQLPVDSNFDQFANIHSFSRSNVIPSNIPQPKSDRQTPAILNACLSGDRVCSEILGSWAFSSLLHGMGSEFGVPIGIMSHNGEPSTLNNLNLGTVERIGGIAKLLHMITSVPLTPIQRSDESYSSIRYLPGIPQHLESEDEVINYVVNLAVSHRDQSFVKLISNPDYEFYRIEENTLARRLLRKHKKLERSVNRRGRNAFESSSRSRSVNSCDGSTISSRPERSRSATNPQRWGEQGVIDKNKPWGGRTPDKINVRAHIQQYLSRPERQVYRMEQQVISKSAVWPAPLATVGTNQSPRKSEARQRSFSVTLGGNTLSPPVAMRSNKDFSSSTQSSAARSAGKITRYPPSFSRSKSYSHR